MNLGLTREALISDCINCMKKQKRLPPNISHMDRDLGQQSICDFPSKTATCRRYTLYSESDQYSLPFKTNIEEVTQNLRLFHISQLTY